MRGSVRVEIRLTALDPLEDMLARASDDDDFEIESTLMDAVYWPIKWAVKTNCRLQTEQDDVSL